MFMKNLSLIAGIFFASLPACSWQSFAADSSKNVGLGSHNSRLPIEITSDALEVLQQENKAIFSGHVIATQGDVKMKSEKMTVFYKSSDTGKPAAAKNKNLKEEKKSPSAPSEKNSIEKIIVEKNVFLSTPEETASGSSGLYDVVNNKIFLNNNVVLTRDKNVLKGNNLVYDFATGKSVLTSQNEVSGQPKQRVKALFVPNSDEKTPSKK